MRTCVVGAGGIGMVYAARLGAVLAGDDERHVTLTTRRPAARDALALGLVVMRPDTPEEVVRVDALLVGDVPPHTQDVVILAAKSHDNEELLPVVDEMLAPDGVCLSVQNGVTNTASLHAVLGPERGVQGATAVVATQLADDRVLEASVFATWLPATMPHVSALAAWMHEAGLQPVLVDDVDRIQWHKAALGGVGPISVVLEEPLGVVVTRPEARRVLRSMTAETVAVANAVGVALELADELDAQQRLVDSLPRDAMSSMYNDYRTGRRPELEERVGEITRLADAHGVPVPVTRTVLDLARARFTARAFVNDSVDDCGPPGYRALVKPPEQSDAERAVRATVGWWDSGWEAFAELDPVFLARTVDLVAVPWSDVPGGLDRATKHLIAIALYAACTTGDRAGIEGHVRAARDEGVELPAIVEVLELASALGMQSCTVGLPILVEQLAARSQFAPRDLTDDEMRVREAFVARRGYWSDFWENLLRLSPRFMEGYLALSTVPWESGPLPPKVKELVYVAINASPNHLHEPSIRLHIGNALDRGATTQELVEVLELVTIVGANACRDGHLVLAAEHRPRVEEQ